MERVFYKKNNGDVFEYTYFGELNIEPSTQQEFDEAIKYSRSNGIEVKCFSESELDLFKEQVNSKYAFAILEVIEYKLKYYHSYDILNESEVEELIKIFRANEKFIHYKKRSIQIRRARNNITRNRRFGKRPWGKSMKLYYIPDFEPHWIDVKTHEYFKALAQRTRRPNTEFLTVTQSLDDMLSKVYEVERKKGHFNILLSENNDHNQNYLPVPVQHQKDVCHKLYGLNACGGL